MPPSFSEDEPKNSLLFWCPGLLGIAVFARGSTHTTRVQRFHSTLVFASTRNQPQRAHSQATKFVIWSNYDQQIPDHPARGGDSERAADEAKWRPQGRGRPPGIRAPVGPRRGGLGGPRPHRGSTSSPIPRTACSRSRPAPGLLARSSCSTRSCADDKFGDAPHHSLLPSKFHSFLRRAATAPEERQRYLRVEHPRY